MKTLNLTKDTRVEETFEERYLAARLPISGRSISWTFLRALGLRTRPTLFGAITKFL